MIQRDDASCIWLPRDAASMDIDSLSREPHRLMAEKDLSILPGYAPRSSAAFNDWVDEWRDQLRLRVLKDVVAAANAAATQQDWSLALALANQVLKLDPTDETALRIRARSADHLSREPVVTPIPSIRIGPGSAVAQRLQESAMIPGWRTRASMSAAQQDTAMVGRELPVQRLRSNAKSTLQGEVCAAYVSAPAGFGKSRLVREIAAWMSEHGAAVCVAPCDRQDSHRPLSVFIQAVPILQSLPGAAGCDPNTLECLSRVTHFTAESTDLDSRDSAAQLTASIRAAVIDLIDAVADEQPLLLVIEDVHWIDPASWSLLRTIIDRAQRSVLLLCTSRLGWQYGTWGPPEGFRLDELLALDGDASRAHASNYLARLNRKADDAYLAWCVDTANGNPYFIEELINYWVTTGEQYSAPPSLVALVEARLAHIRPDALRVIQAAATLGKYSTVDLLQQVLEFPTYTLFSSIEELGEAGLLTVSGAEGAATAPVICRHDLIGRAATRSLSAQGRALLHHAAARAMESANAEGQSAERLWDCAEHWHAAGQAERSISAAIACARHLHDMGLIADAITRCEVTLAKCTTHSSMVRVLRVVAEAQFSAHEWRACCETVKQIRILNVEERTATLIHDDIELLELRASRNLQRNWASALESATRCVRSATADPRHRVRASIIALKIATNVGAMDDMDVIYRDAALLVADERVTPIDRLTLHMVYHAIRGKPGIGAHAARELLAHVEQTVPQRHRLEIMMDCGGALRRGAPFPEAATIYDSVFRTAVKLRCFDTAADACHRLIEINCDAWQINEASAWVARYRQLRRPRMELRRARNLRVAIARVHLWREEWNAAAAVLEFPKHDALWEDSVAMFSGGALAAKIRLDIGRAHGKPKIAQWIAKLTPLNDRMRTSGTQDYETYSLYLAHRYVGHKEVAEVLLRNYVSHERRDHAPLSPEIAAELERLAATPARQDANAVLPACATATDETRA